MMYLQIFGGIFLVLLLIGFFLFDKLLSIEYKEHFDIWEKDGKQSGLLWFSKGDNRSATANGKLVSAWLFFTPDWVKKDQKAIVFIRWFRVTFGALFILLLGMFSLFIVGVVAYIRFK